MTDSYYPANLYRVVRSNGLFDLKYNFPGMPFYFHEERLELFPEMCTPPFWCEDLETIYIKTGHVNVIVNGEATPVNAGELIVVTPGCVHYIATADNEPCTFYIGIMNEELFVNTGVLQTNFIQPLFHSLSPSYAVYRKTAAEHSQMIDLLRRIERLSTQLEPAYELQCVALCHEYLYYLWHELRDALFFPTPRDDFEANSFRRILVHIHDNYDRKITIQKLCAVGDVSRNRCFELFEKYTGVTPSRYIMNYRLECAKELLKNSVKSISEIALSCGFAHQSHFGRHFLNRFGVTPRHYRNRPVEN